MTTTLEPNAAETRQPPITRTFLLARCIHRLKRDVALRSTSGGWKRPEGWTWQGDLETTLSLIYPSTADLLQQWWKRYQAEQGTVELAARLALVIEASRAEVAAILAQAEEPGANLRFLLERARLVQGLATAAADALAQLEGVVENDRAG